MVRGGVCPGDRADDVEVLEQSYTLRRSEVRGRQIQSLHSGDGYPGLTGLQHHHHRVDVRDGDTGVFTKAPGEDREAIEWEKNDSVRVRAKKANGHHSSGLGLFKLEL